MAPQPASRVPRLRQAVLAARDLDAVAGLLREELGLGEPYADPAVDYFGLRNAVFALGDTFLEVVSPVREDTAAGRLLDRRGGDGGYMVMFQTDDLGAARSRAAAAGVREVFEVSLEDIAEVHLHPADMRGAIVSISQPQPPESWRWAGPEWERRQAPLRVAGATVAVREPEAVSERWSAVVGGMEDIRFARDDDERGLVEVTVAGAGRKRDPIEIAGVRFTFEEEAP
jgi:hypothetical protein